MNPRQSFTSQTSSLTDLATTSILKNDLTFIGIILQLLKKKFDSKIVVAAHPRANISDYNNFFKGREIFNSKTIDLVKNCSCVLAHTSTAISYAVIFKKPIIFLTSNEIIKSYDDYRVHSNARILDAKLLNIDSDNDKYIHSTDFNVEFSVPPSATVISVISVMEPPVIATLSEA